MTTAEMTTDSHVKVLPPNGYITALMTTLRDSNTESDRFADTVHRLAAQLMVLGMCSRKGKRRHGLTCCSA
jgi:uracil phosphoribosyltransferase